MAELVYILCAAMSVLCAVLLARFYFKRKNALLLATAVCFAGLALNNILLFADRVLFPASIDLSIIRTIPALAGLIIMIYGLIREVTL